MSETDLVKSRGLLTADRALQTVGGILLTICLMLTGWCLHQVFAHEGRLIKVETRTESVMESLKEMKLDIREIKEAITKKGGV